MIKKIKNYLREKKKQAVIKRIEGLTTQFANNYMDVCTLKPDDIMGAAVHKSTGEMKVVKPKVIYAWLDPEADMEVNRGWLLCNIQDMFFEIKTREKKDDVTAKPSGEAYSFEELKERIKLGDFDHMVNVNTEKTVSKELADLFEL